jgi:hypothetical protein
MWHYTDDHFDTESPNDDCNILVNTAISKCDNVVISSICPRLDDTHGNIAKGNTTLSKLANDEHCLFLNNEVTFKLQNSSSRDTD